MARGYRPDLADEIEPTAPNLAYGQLSRANQTMQTYAAELRRVADAPDLPTLQGYARDLARDRTYAGRVGRLQRSRAWRDLGALKRELLDLWLTERNRLAEEVVREVKARR